MVKSTICFYILPDLFLCLLSGLQNLNVTSHPLQFAVVGEAQCLSSLCNEPEKAGRQRQRSETRLPKKATQQKTIHIHPLQSTLLYCKLRFSKKENKPVSVTVQQRICLNNFHSHSSTFVTALPSFLDDIAINATERQKLVRCLQTAVHCNLTCRKMETQINQKM